MIALPRSLAPALLAAALLLLASAPARADEVDVERAEWQAELDAVMPVVADVRGLAWKREIALVMRDGDAADPWLSRVSGYYRGGSDTVTIIRGQPGTDPFSRRLLLAHELAHALQDQHWPRTFKRLSQSHDSALAMQAAVEGEAHMVAIAYALRVLGLDCAIAAADLPALRCFALLAYDAGRIISGHGRDRPPADRDEHTFPYTNGLGFAQAVCRARGGGLNGLDGVLDDPPRSTEEVLHPEKYLAERREGPVGLEIPTRPDGPEWSLGGEITEGEWKIRGMLRDRGLSRRAAERAAAGWAGDARAVWRRGRDVVWIWQIACDSARDADELAAAWRLPARKPGGGALANPTVTHRKGKSAIELRFDLPGSVEPDPVPGSVPSLF